ncbi:MAG TPA: hypothetical protein VIQ99_09130, partial [Gammaproteobacteria bacterium]
PDFTGVWTNYRGAGAPAGNRGAPRAQPLLTPEAQAKSDRYRQVTAGTNYTPGGYCVGGGMPSSMLGSGGYPMEIIQRPEQITIIYEAHNEIRRVYFGDRAPDPASVFPERNGRSVGRWEGDTLVVETDRLVEQVDTQYPHSDQAKIVERYRLTTESDGGKVLTASLTMTDPKFLKEPFTVEKKWQAVPNGRVMTYECTEPEWLELLDRLMSGTADDSRSE